MSVQGMSKKFYPRRNYYIVYLKKACPRLRDPNSWLSLEVWVSSPNLQDKSFWWILYNLMLLEHSVAVTCVQSFGRKARRRTAHPMFHFNSIPPLRTTFSASSCKCRGRRLSIEFAALKAPFTAPPLHLMARVPSWSWPFPYPSSVRPRQNQTGIINLDNFHFLV